MHWLVKFSKNIILQGSVATPVRCVGKFNDSFVAFMPNFISKSLSVQEFLTSVIVLAKI